MVDKLPGRQAGKVAIGVEVRPPLTPEERDELNARWRTAEAWNGIQYLCQGTTKAGDTCTSLYTYLTADGPWCYNHDPHPEVVARRKAISKDASRKAQAAIKRRKWREEVAKTGVSGPYELAADGHMQVRWSAEMRKYVAEGWHSKVESGELTQYQVAKELGVDQSTISRWFQAVNNDLKRVELADKWEMSDYAKYLLLDFEEFRKLFPPSDPAVGEYVTEPFHRRWFNMIEDAVADGGKVQILSPPRHGKSELLLHYVVWQIVRNPNIRIMWVSLNEETAEETTSAVKEILEDEEFIRWFLPPGETFVGKPWAADRFKVGNRRKGIKGLTLVAIGRQGGTLSKDVDLLILDDIEDAKSTATAEGRAGTRRWFNVSIMSRKMGHTALVKIGSRQHPDDLDHHLIESTQWKTTVEEMHDPTCDLPDTEDHLHVDCMLWPSVRTHALWRDLRDSFAADPDLGVAYFDMVYQNNPAATQLLTFTKDLITSVYDPTLTLGIPRLEPSTRQAQIQLIGGIDPAAVGYMASYIWAYAPNTAADDPRLWEQWMVDFENRLGGGVNGVREAIRWGFETYGVPEWVVEDNSFQKVIMEDRDLLDYCNRRGILLHGHQTLHNKTDENFGVTSMVKLFQNNTIHLPAADAATLAKTNLYRAQLVRWDGRKSGKGARADIVMASWFPLSFIRARASQAFQSVRREPSDGFVWGDDDFDPIFEEMDWLTAV